MTKETHRLRRATHKAFLDRPTKTHKKRLVTLVTLMALSAPAGLAIAADATTDYDRNKNPRPEKSWHTVEAGEAPTTINIGRPGSESDTPNFKIAPSGAVAPEAFDRIKETDGYIEMQARTKKQDETFTEYENRTGVLEGLDRHWNYDPSLDVAGTWTTTSAPRITDWTPNINGQLAGFEQSATFRVTQKRPIEEYEKNYVTGSDRLTNIRTEQRVFNETRSRQIDVATGNWTNTGSRSCPSWSPATNTVNQGQSFTQTRSCTQKQQRNVSYTVASTGENPGGAWTQTQTLNLPESRSATGTKAVGTWQHVGSPSYADYDDPNISRYNSPLYDIYRRPEGDRCSKLGSKMIHILSAAGYASYFLYECKR